MDEKLKRLFAEYRASVPDFDPSPNFMPKLWQRIEARRSEPLSLFRRFAEVCLVTTLAAALLMTAFTPQQPADPGVAGHYVDVLAAEQNLDRAASLDIEDIM